MPRESRSFIKTAFCWLALGFLLGAVLLICKSVGKVVPEIIAIEHAHIEFVGWLVNMVIGFSLWMLPTNVRRFPESRGRAPSAQAMLVYYLLNCGLVIRILVEPWSDVSGPSTVTACLLIAAASAQLAAILFLLPLVWSRIRSPAAPRLSRE